MDNSSLNCIMNWFIAYILIPSILIVDSLRFKSKNFIPVDDYPDEGLTPEKISAQLGIPIRTTTSPLFDIKTTRTTRSNLPRRTRFSLPGFTTFYPNTQYSRRHIESAEEDVFETKSYPFFETTRQRPSRSTTRLVLLTRSTTTLPFIHLDNGDEGETTTTKATRRPVTRKSTIQIDNEVETTTRHRPTTTHESFLIDNEVIGERKSTTTRPDTFQSKTTETLTQRTTETESSFPFTTTTFPFRSTEAQGRIGGEVVVVDGEAGQSKQYPFTFLPQTQAPTPATSSFNPWAFFTTFPPTSQSTFIPTFGQTFGTAPFVDFAPNCLSNAVLCREGGSYERFMRTYCRETCRLYDNTVSHETQENCKDIADNCKNLKEYCFAPTSPYYLLLRHNCQQTCQYCKSSKVQTVSSNFPTPETTTQRFPTFQPGPPPLEPQISQLNQTNAPFPRQTYGECKDIGQNCRQFLGDCEQVEMASVLSQYCAATCGFCSSCEDSLGSQCDEFIRKGFCQSPHFRLAIKKRYCRRSCNLCEQTPSALPDFLPAIPNFG